MTKLRNLLLGGLLLISLVDCKSTSKKAASSGPSPAPSSPAAEAGLPSCSTQLALANLGTPASVDSTKLSVGAPKATVEHPVTGSSFAVLTIQAQVDPAAQFIAFQTCNTSTKECFTGRLVAPAGDTENPDMLLGQDCRMPAGSYQLTVRSCVEPNLDSAKAFGAEGNGGDGHCGKSSAPVNIGSFPGNDSQVTKVCKRLASAHSNLDKASGRARKRLKSINPATVAESARTDLSNVANMGPILAYLMQSPARQAVQVASQNSQGMQLADTGASNSSCGTDVDNAIQTVAAAPASPAPDQAAQAAAVAAAAAANATTPVPDPNAATQPPGTDFQYAQLWCTGADRQTAGYSWTQVDGKFTGQTYTNPDDSTTWGCVPPGASVVNPVALPNTPAVDGSGSGRNNLLVGGGSALLAVGAVIAIGSGVALTVNKVGKGNTFHARLRSLWADKIGKSSSFLKTINGVPKADLVALGTPVESARMATRIQTARVLGSAKELASGGEVYRYDPDVVAAIESPREPLGSPSKAGSVGTAASDRTSVSSAREGTTVAKAPSSEAPTKASKMGTVGPLIGLGVGAVLITLGGVGIGEGMKLASSETSSASANIIAAADVDVGIALMELDAMKALLLQTIGKAN